MSREFNASGETVVWKYVLDFTADSMAETHIPGSIIHVDTDPQDNWCAWAVVAPGLPETKRNVVIRGTGDPLPAGIWGYLNTCHHGPFVFHTFVGVPR